MCLCKKFFKNIRKIYCVVVVVIVVGGGGGGGYKMTIIMSY